MAFDVETPSGVMYATFKQFGGISNKEVASMVFSPGFSYGGVPLISRLDERSFVTRNVVHVAPGTYGVSAFNDFAQLADRLCALMFARYPGEEGRITVVNYFSTLACDQMGQALQDWGQSSHLYHNTVAHLQGLGTARASELASLLVMYFTIVGCLGNVTQATDMILNHIQYGYAQRSGTMVRTSYDTLIQSRPEDQPMLLGLCKIINGVVTMPPYVLSAAPEGTEIGSLATSACAINDVDATVSKRHLRIFQDASGLWYAEGLGSTNGTSLLRGSDGTKVVVEPPRAQREPGMTYPPVPIYPQDTLRLAGTTFFAVIELSV